MIIHGNRNFGYAPITSAGAAAFGTPVMVPGLVNFTIEVEQETSAIYADDVVFCNVKGAKVRTATGTFRYIPAEYLELLGFKEETNGMLVDTGTFAPHCIFFETTEEDCATGTVTQTLHYLYNVTGSEPTFESNTDEDEIEAQEIEIEYSATASSIAVDTAGAGVQYGKITRTEDNAEWYDTFKTKVLLPKDSISG